MAAAAADSGVSEDAAPAIGSSHGAAPAFARSADSGEPPHDDDAWSSSPGNRPGQRAFFTASAIA